MKAFSKVFAHVLDQRPDDGPSAVRRQIHREWDRQRALAMSPSERAEIDAIFSRNL
ncbi:MAG: hypothetical protein QG661_1874 [Actinomycetota bacterium]|nr:hypothetical protein [Actinomycetota bacterium]